MEQTLDCRGLSCPQPVIETKKALAGISGGSVVIIVDNQVARENILRFAGSNSYPVEVNEQGGEYYLRITKEIATECQMVSTETVIMITAASIGRGDDELGQVLMKNYLYTLCQGDLVPGGIVFLNAGVLLTTEGSAVLDSLRDLEQKGTELLSCGLCLDFYSLKNKLAVGQISNMYTIAEHLDKAAKVINIG